MHTPEFPALFRQSLHDQLGMDADVLLDAMRQPASVSIRYNERKTTAGHYESEQPVFWCSGGKYLPTRPVFTLDPLLHAGAYYVQEASSMFLARLKALIASLGDRCRVLDACAAPGGKSTLLAALLPVDALLVSNEVIRSRAAILIENLSKWGFPNTVITSGDPKQFAALPSFFDMILVDAPCSGEGLFRKDPSAMEEWSPAHVLFCAERQRRIVVDAWNALRENGLLVYSTCTFNRIENEENVQWIKERLGAETVPLAIPPEWGIVESEGGYRFYPHRVKGEGFFMCILRKTAIAATPPAKRKTAVRLPLSKHAEEVKNKLTGDYIITEQTAAIQALPAAHYEAIAQLSAVLNVLQAGILTGERKGTSIVPETALAWSIALRPEAFPRVEIDKPTALRFLHRDTIILPHADKGYVLLTHQGIPLGFVKNLGNRTNNLYPPAWRIRMKI